MTTGDVEYLGLLEDLSRGDADLLTIRAHHFKFWSQYAASAPSLTASNRFRAYFLGAVPSELPSTWFLSPQVYLQRIGLYADVFVFDDIVGSVLAKVARARADQLATLGEQVRMAMRAVVAIGPAVRAGLVQFLPSDEFSSEPIEVEALRALTFEQGAYDLPDRLGGMLTPAQQTILGKAAGHAILHQVNRALFLQSKRNFVPSADDTCFRILVEKAKHDRTELGETGDLYVLRQIRPEYLCSTTELMMELRKEDKVVHVRRFLRSKMDEIFSRGPEGFLDQKLIDDFSRGLNESFREVEAELAELKRKFSHDLIQKASTGLAAAVSLHLGPGGSAPAWVAAIVNSVAALSGKSVIDSIKDYLRDRKSLVSRPAFLLGAHLE